MTTSHHHIDRLAAEQRITQRGLRIVIQQGRERSKSSYSFYISLTIFFVFAWGLISLVLEKKDVVPLKFSTASNKLSSNKQFSSSNYAFTYHRNNSNISGFVRYYFSPYHNFSSFLQGPALALLPNHMVEHNPTDAAVGLTDTYVPNLHHGAPPCVLPETLNFHFPHVLQKLYSCFSWWQTTSKAGLWIDENGGKASPRLLLASDSKDDFLIVQRRSDWAVQRFQFTLVDLLQVVFNLTILFRDDDSILRDTKRPQLYVEPTLGNGIGLLPAFEVHDLEDLHILRDGIVGHLFPNRSTQGCGGGSYSRPRIRILNRRRDRSLGNLEFLVKELHAVTHDEEPVTVTYFEDATFKDQVDFFSSTDILISPHGAQLTGAAFLPRCAAVLEIFPRHYYLPYFFGSLVNAAGHNYGAIYNHEVDVDPMEDTIRDWEGRWENRAVQNFTYDINSVIESVRRFVQEWHYCCDSNQPSYAFLYDHNSSGR